MDSIKTAKCYTNLKGLLIQFTSEKYNKSFTSYFFTDINEQFLLDFAF
jgi:hypothetical protein